MNADRILYNFLSAVAARQGYREDAADMVMYAMANRRRVDQFSVTLGRTEFVLANAPTSPSDVILSVNGQEQLLNRDFVVDGSIVTWISTDFLLEVGDVIQVVYGAAFQKG